MSRLLQLLAGNMWVHVLLLLLEKSRTQRKGQMFLALTNIYFKYFYAGVVFLLTSVTFTRYYLAELSLHHSCILMKLMGMGLTSADFQQIK